MKAALAVLSCALLWQATPGDEPAADPHFLQYERPLTVPAGSTGQACAVVDAGVYAHAASASLNDLRLYGRGGAEVPFTFTESSPQRVAEEPATVRNLGLDGKAIVFDLQMPRRPYSAVTLNMDAKDFVGSAEVSARAADAHVVKLGAFAVFDLSAQHLGRSLTLPLQEESFPELHVRLSLQAAPGSAAQDFAAAVVQGAAVPPSREAQTLYTAVAATSGFARRGHDTVATLHVPAHVPVERATFALDPGFARNFLRAVTVTAKPDVRPAAEDSDAAGAGAESMTGEISQVHLPQSAGENMPIDHTQLAVETVLGANLRSGATVELAVANGDDAPLPLRAVQLEMRQRRLCFDAVAGVAAYTLRYGDAALRAPVYDYSRLFVPSAQARAAALGPESPNPQFTPRADVRPYSERHPELMWIGLVAALAALGGVALRSARRQSGAGH